MFGRHTFVYFILVCDIIWLRDIDNSFRQFSVLFVFLPKKSCENVFRCVTEIFMFKNTKIQKKRKKSNSATAYDTMDIGSHHILL